MRFYFKETAATEIYTLSLHDALPISRVCAYDRFGTGTSDAPTTPQTFEDQVADLHELLDAVGEPGPYVVVGPSFVGAEAVTFRSAEHTSELPSRQYLVCCFLLSTYTS